MKRWLPLLALAAAIGIAVTFQSWPSGERPPPPAAPSGSDRQQSAAPSAAPAKPDRAGREGISVVLYFPSRQYVETGDDSLARLLPERTTLDTRSADTESDQLASDVLSALGRGPTAAAALPAIPDRVKIRGVHVRADIAEVDMARTGLNGSSLEEQLLVRSIVQTLTQLPRVRAVRFLIDGEPAQTLMGHVSTVEPLTSF